MHFINPWYLTGLLALAIPIIIHLFNFHRYKKVYFTHVRFLEVLQIETRRTSRLRSIILLLLRLLFITAVVLAFAQPYVGRNTLWNRATGRTISIYLDNSLSMIDVRGDKNRFSQAKSKAYEITALFTTGDQYHLVTNDLKSYQQRLVTQNQIQLWLNEAEPSARQVSAAEIMEMQAHQMNNSNPKGGIAFFISDFSRSFFNPGPPPDTSHFWVFVPVKSNITDNVSIDSAWFEEPLIYPGLQTTLKVKLTNFSAQNPAEVGVKLTLNKLQRGFKSISIQPLQSQIVSIPFLQSDTGFITGLVEISDNGFPYDNTLYLSFKGQPLIQVLTINGSEPNSFLRRLYAADSSFIVRHQLYQEVNYSLIHQSSLTIFNELTEYPSGLVTAIKKALDEGHCLTILPHPSKGFQSLEAFLQQIGIKVTISPSNEGGAVGEININGILFKNVIEEMPEYPALPIIKNYLHLKTGMNPAPEIQMKLKNDEPFLLGWTVGKGRVFLQACPLREEFTDFMHNNLFVPAYLNMALVGQFQNPLYGIAQKPGFFVFENNESNTDKAPELVNDEKKLRSIPPFRRSNGLLQIGISSELSKDGIYHVMTGVKNAGTLAINLPRNESDPAMYSPEEIIHLLQKQGWKNFQVLDAQSEMPLKAALEAGGNNPSPRKWLAWAALLFLTSEVILLRFWKK